jgi:hypothetical protein
VALGVMLAVRLLGTSGSAEIVTWLACAFAVLSPVSGVVMAAQAARNPSPNAEASPRRTAMLVQYAQLEAAVLFCGIALVVGPHIWPLFAALVPLGVMVVEFPRAAVARTG